jgi:hypothetical protein
MFVIKLFVGFQVSTEKKKLSSYGSVEQSDKGFVNAGLKIGNNDAVPAPPTDNPTNPFLAKPAATNPFAPSE